MKLVLSLIYLQMRFNLRSLIWNSGICDPKMQRLFNLSDLSDTQLKNLGQTPTHPFRQCKLLENVFSNYFLV